MDQVEPEELYDQRGDVAWARPLLQGDVFDGIVLPGFGEKPMKVQIVSHPCAMRTGANLTQRVTVAPVEPHAAVSGTAWDGSLRIMPLAELSHGEHFATRFVDITAAPGQLLTRPRRIATLSHLGIYVLQQRLIKHYTRVEMPLELLRRESAAVLTEAVLQWDWLEEVLTDAELGNESAIEAEAKVFDNWLGEGSPSCRELLRHEVHHSDVRRRVRHASRERARDHGDDQR
jgi:hypothetical protein